MSKKFSKILLICALAVTLPLMIIGTSLAAYYSLNATMAVGIQLDGQSTSANAYAKVVYNKSRHTDTFEINASHTKTITLKAEANGYDFKGWYEGDLEAYAMGDGKWIDETGKTEVEVKIADIDNVLAVFGVHEYAVTYSYPADPTVATPYYISDVPAGFSNTLTYGSALPTTSNFTAHEGWYLKGWDLISVDGTTIIDNNGGNHYTVAEFPELDTYVLRAVWDHDTPITITYKYDGNTIGTTAGYETVGAVVADPATHQASLGEGGLNDGEKLVWKTSNNQIVSAGNRLYADTELTLTVVDVTYTLTVTPAEDMALKNGVSSTVSFTRNSTANLNNILNNANWNNTYSFWTFAGIKIGETTYTTSAQILTAFETASAHADVTLQATSVLAKNFTSVEFVVNNLNTDVTYKTTSDSTIGDYTDFNQNVYAGVGSTVGGRPDNAESTTNLLTWISRGSTLYKDSECTIPVSLYEIKMNGKTISVEELEDVENMTINDLIDLYYRNVQTKPALGETFTINTLYLRFF